MAEKTKIEWADDSFNPWVGCTKVSPGCDHCYAEAWAERYGQVEWGRGAARKLTSAANWKQPIKWNKQAQAAGRRRRVFCASLADVFDNEVPNEWRERLWQLIAVTPFLDWLLLTKRIGNAEKMLPLRYKLGGMPNIWLGASVVNQEEAERDIPKLLKTPAHIRFLSIEPLLSGVDLCNLHLAHFPEMFGIPQRDCFYNALTGIGKIDQIATVEFASESQKGNKIDWVIVGGESGKGARPIHPAWVKLLRDQCVAFDVPFFFKQWGEWGAQPDGNDNARACWLSEDGTALPDVGAVNDSPCAKPCLLMFRDGKHRTGRELDGEEWNQLPEGLNAVSA